MTRGANELSGNVLDDGLSCLLTLLLLLSSSLQKLFSLLICRPTLSLPLPLSRT